jgi:hypothetical protein
MRSIAQFRPGGFAWNPAFLRAACPGIVLITLFWCTALAADVEGNLRYKSVEEARRAVTRLPGAITKSVDGWFIVEDRENRTTWLFSEKEEIGHPSVIRRQVVESDGEVKIETHVLCEANEIACSELVRRFAVLDAQARERVTGSPEGG